MGVPPWFLILLTTILVDVTARHNNNIMAKAIEKMVNRNIVSEKGLKIDRIDASDRGATLYNCVLHGHNDPARLVTSPITARSGSQILHGVNVIVDLVNLRCDFVAENARVDLLGDTVNGQGQFNLRVEGLQLHADQLEIMLKGFKLSSLQVKDFIGLKVKLDSISGTVSGIKDAAHISRNINNGNAAEEFNYNFASFAEEDKPFMLQQLNQIIRGFFRCNEV